MTACSCTATCRRALRLPAHDPGALDLAEDILSQGGLVAFPTDTVYGIGADARRESAVAQLYVAKGRPPEKAIPLLVDRLDDARAFLSAIPEVARSLIEAFWPGGLTLILPIAEQVSPIISSGPGIAIRMPDHSTPRTLSRRLGAPLAATSANQSGGPDPLDAQQVVDQLGQQLDLILDGGPTAGGHPSTIVDLTTTPPRILRVGPISVAQIAAVVPEVIPT